MALMRSLSGRLLMVTIVVVMLAEVAIFLPSVARFWQDYLMDRVRRSEIAALAIKEAPNNMVSEQLQAELLARSEVLNVVARRDGSRQLMLQGETMEPISATIDLREPGIFELMYDALACLANPNDTVIRVIAYAPADMGKELEITVRTGPLTQALRAYGLKILALSLVISLTTAVMVFFAVRRAVVRPITKVISNVKAFSENPEDPGRIIAPRSRVGEIADAERAVCEMQRDVHAALKARARLASLGEAVAKISHDLRNMLGTTQLMADRLEASEDPIVARTAPKLIGSVDRAIRLCQSTLAYGKAEEAPPEARTIMLAELAEEVIEGAILGEDALVTGAVDVPHDAVVEADPEQLYRILSNLARNAVQAIRASGRAGQVSITATPEETKCEISVLDTGPGMPAKAREHLFKPFQGGTRREGTGLGLAIAHELVRANGGELRLVASTTAGTEFRIVFPSTAEIAAA